MKTPPCPDTGTPGTALLSDGGENARTTLVDPSVEGQVSVLTTRWETDARTALARGLKEYLETLSIDMPGGRHLKFAQVLQTWATPEVPAKYPAATVYANDPGTFDSSSFTPNVETILGTRVQIRFPCEFVQLLYIEVWSQDPMERMGLEMMLETAFNPFDGMYGFRLNLPHYFNLRGTYEPRMMAYLDSEDSAQKRWRRIGFQLEGRVSQGVLKGSTPNIQPRAEYPEVVDAPSTDPHSIAYEPALAPGFGTPGGPQPRRAWGRAR